MPSDETKGITAAEEAKVNGAEEEAARDAEAAPLLQEPKGGKERKSAGLSSVDAERLLVEHGLNEVPVVKEPLWRLFLRQFEGYMVFVLEVCLIISAAVQDWPDFAVIFVIIVVNAVLGFREQLKARRALESLTDGTEKRITARRDGHATDVPTTHLVPGDVILLKGGDMTPADVDWVEGDVLSVDTAALTGEPIPRKYPSNDYGTLILGGTTIRAGEAYAVVQKTGANTEIGAGQKDIIADRQKASLSLFQTRVMTVVKVIIVLAILDAIVLLLVQGLVRERFNNGASEPILVALSVLIAAVPVALPLILQVTIAIGAYHMAKDHNAIVTRMSALEDIASMSVLCSDKTGTLTTAHLTISTDRIWVGHCENAGPSSTKLRSVGGEIPTASPSHGAPRVCVKGFALLDSASAEEPMSLTEYQDQVLLAAALCSNPDKRDDAVDGGVWRAFDARNVALRGALLRLYERFDVEKLTGFNPDVKRTLAILRRASDGHRIRVAKGLVSKILDTKDGGADSGEYQWTCEQVAQNARYAEYVAKADEGLSSAGYKTLAVGVGDVDGPMHFLGLLPMIDPPRADTVATIRRLHSAGIDVKMVTGDHLNIAKETAKLVGLGVNILPGADIRQASYTRDELIYHADGFAQVLPRDKRECVLTLQHRYGLVVGMTGDGVNDAPALSAAQCGIAVHDATDAARNAAAMILTSEGLGAVYGAVVESRRIFARLFAYVTYRLAATIQVLLFLTIIILAFDCEINPLLVILLALINDLTMVPVAEDRQVASSVPQSASVASLVGNAVTMGLCAAVSSFVFYLVLDDMLPDEGFEASGAIRGVCDEAAQSAIWLQISFLAEMLIFAARAPGLFFLNRPSVALMVSTTIGMVVSAVLAAHAFSGTISWEAVGVIFAYDLAWIFVIDVIKLFYKVTFEHGTQGVIDDEEPPAEVAEATGRPAGPAERAPIGASSTSLIEDISKFTATGRVEAHTIRNHQSGPLARYSTGPRSPVPSLRGDYSVARHTRSEAYIRRR